MQPDHSQIKIETTEGFLYDFINEVILTPRLNVLRWSELTKQSPGLKIGYPAQHLASLVTGVEGARTGARGDDLTDGSEVKSCNRVDQLDTCKNPDCKQKVMRAEMTCSKCGSEEIERKKDSKWLISVRSEAELNLQTNVIDRFVLILMDYPNFDEYDFEQARMQIFEIWPQFSPCFTQLLTKYYYDIYLEHINNNPQKTPAPKNLWPESFQFYKCQPIKTFECIIKDFNTNPSAEITKFVPPHQSRADIEPEKMPTDLLNFSDIHSLYINDPQKLEGISNKAFDILANTETVTKAQQKKVVQAVKASTETIPISVYEHINLRGTSVAMPHVREYLRRT